MTTWIAALGVEEIEPEDVMPFSHDGVPYAIYQSAGGAFFATAGYCTHERELLCDGLVMDDAIECPKHNGRFDYRSGKAMGAPAMTDLQTYPVRISDGTIYIGL